MRRISFTIALLALAACASAKATGSQLSPIVADHTGSAANHERECQNGDATGCASLGDQYARGKGVPKDPVNAASLYEQACDQGSAAECTNLGALYERGEGSSEDQAKAAALYQRGCDLGDAVACSSLSTCHSRGSGVPKDFAKAASFAKAACEAGCAAGCSELGLLYEQGHGVPKDAAQAAALDQQGCDEGSTVACNNLGVLYEKGSGVAKDGAKAVALYQKACDGGHAQACGNLGSCYERGVGVERDTTSAASIFDKGCAAGYVRACASLAWLYTNELTLPTRDPSRAVELYRKACSGGVETACEALKLPSATAAAPMQSPRKSFSEDDFIVVPIRAFVLRGGSALGDGRADFTGEVSNVVAELDQIFEPAGIYFHLVKSAEPMTFRDDTLPRGYVSIARSLPSEKDGEGFRIFFVKDMDVNGAYLGDGDLLVREYPTLRPVDGETRDPVARVVGHQLGTALGLTSSSDARRLMANATTGADLDEAGIGQLRSAARKVRGVRSFAEAVRAGNFQDGIASIRANQGSIGEVP